MRKNNFSRNFLVLLVFTAITLFVWIGTEVYQILTRQEYPKVLKEQLETLDPAIDTTIIDGLSSKNNYQKEDLGIIQTENSLPTPTVAPRVNQNNL